MSIKHETPADIIQKIKLEMFAGYKRLFEVTESTPFRHLVAELYDKPLAERPEFVSSIILDELERQKRAVFIPDDILVLRSAFGDRRPTLFCLKKYLPVELHRYWQNVNVTFDNPSQEEVSERLAWRKPLNAGVQAAVIMQGISP
jgi:hypothetical protein